MLNPKQVSIPVTDSEGHEKTEELKEKQSDGTYWNIPKRVGGNDHEHYFKMAPNDRVAKCSCGLAGYVFPYNSRLINGHIYDLKGNKKI
jgi:hypothetical protein